MTQHSYSNSPVRWFARAALLGAALWTPLHAAEAQPRADDSQARRAVAFNFRGMVNDAPFNCATTFAGVGRSRANVRISDFRMYVHDVTLVDASGARVPVTLDVAEPWQDGQVAMLDFEDATGACSNGTPDVRHQLSGTIPESAQGSWQRLEFTLGVPFERNHGDPTVQPSPLSQTRLFWSWNAGYKFMRVDMRATPADSATAAPKSWVIHLGSTGCTPSGGASVVPTTCANPNRARIALDAINPLRDTITVDLGALLADSDLLVNTEKTAAGCMSAGTDPDCGPLFGSLGLVHPSGPETPAQKLFRVQRRDVTSGSGSAPH